MKGALSWLSGRRRTMASGALVGIAAVTVTTLAVAYDGNPTTEVELHDGSVWLTNASLLSVGRFNHESRQLDGSVQSASSDYDIQQHGDTVLLTDAQASTVARIDTASMTVGAAVETPPGSRIASGGPVTAILDQEGGDLYVLPTAGLTGFEPAELDPVAELGPGGDVAVAADGTVFGVSRDDDAVVTVPVDANGLPADPEERSLGTLTADSEPRITAVGSTPVVLDAAHGTIASPDGLRHELDPAATRSARLQQVSADGDSVFVATAADLIELPLAGGDPQSTPSGAADGVPAAPVWLNGCAYSAWAVSGVFVRDCVDDDHDAALAIPNGAETTDLVFRVNRDVVVLNDVANGMAWLAMEQLQQVDNWDDLVPPEGKESEEEEDSTDETIEVEPPDRSEENQPPVAVDDDFGVRAGRTTVLQVLDNDSDPDGDILTVSLPEGGPNLGEVSAVHNGTAFQIAVEADETGSATFVYEVDDGRGGTDQATVRVAVRPDDVNSPPEAKREPTVPVEVGGTVTYNVLQDWMDPDGDDVFLTSVEPLPGDGVDFTPDGQVTYRATSGTQGSHDIPIVVSDGRSSAAGSFKLDIRPRGSTQPIANNDHVVVRAGQTATVAPLANDVNPTAEPLRLTRVGEVTGATIVPDFASRTFTYRSSTIGTEYVEYVASAGPNTAVGYVRVDVIPDEDVDLPPIAVRDVALLPAGGEALVNVLDNDEDPSGGVLVLQSVQVPEEARGISVSVLNHETLRITDTGTLEETTTLTYRASNGAHSAEGEVVVIPIPAPTTIRPPVANDDDAVVRVGDVVTIDVLDNDYHPNDDELTVVPELVDPLPDPELGEAFVAQNTVRFRANDTPGTVYVTYEVEDSRGQRDSAYVTISVLELDEERNQPPRPEDIEARALAGNETQIAVPLHGIDSDGDSVELVGVATAPTKGRVVAVEQDHLVYQAFPDEHGVDVFTYRVRDRLGAEATASIRVGIAPPEETNQAPYAVTDALYMRPGREVAAPVLANDSDPDGDPIGLVSDGLILPENVPDLTAEVLGDRVLVTAPNEEMETSLQYTIEDDKGARAVGLVMITVDEDVPLMRPIARDNSVLIDDVTEELTADVDVLSNDEDPDGTTQALTVTAEAGTLVEHGILRVSVEEQRQTIRYTITDEDDLEAHAFVHVPSIEDLRPRLMSTEGVEVASGESIDIPLAEHVTVHGGGTVRITQADRVSAVHDNGESLIRDEHTLTYTSQQGYHGPDAITFEVTDGTSVDDPEGRRATLTIPVTVLPPDNQPPVFTNGALQVGAGDGPQTVDLLALTSDPDPDDLPGMSYRIVGGEVSGIDTRIEGQTLVAEADADMRGESTALQLEIHDGHNDPVSGVVTVTVTASSRPLPAANTDVLDDAHQGQSYTVDVLANDFNPFPDQPLRVLDARIDAGTGSVSFDDSSVTVTPGADFHGTMTVMYRIEDATQDADRQAQGRVEVTVLGRPDVPTEVSGSEEMNRSAIVSWRPPADNGSSITHYTVSSVEGPAFTQECAATTCTLTGLSNGVDYRFVVTAHNAVGDSDPSLPSPVVTPDVKPERPAPPRIVDFGDRSLDVEWTAPRNEGSPLQSYTLYISPAAPDGRDQVELPASTRGYTWSGLRNGQSYTFQVAARNAARDPSDTSNPSTADHPAAAPVPPGTPRVEAAPAVGSESQMTVHWSEVTGSGTNGDPIRAYQVRRNGGAGSHTYGEQSPSTTSMTVAVPVSSSDYTYQVRARNKAGWGEWSSASDPRRAIGAPGAPSNVRAELTNAPTNNNPGAAGNEARVSWAATPDSQLNGARRGEIAYVVAWSGGSRQVTGTSVTIGGLATNGTDYTFRVSAVASGSTYTSQTSSEVSSNSIRPWSRPAAPNVSASRSGAQSIAMSASRPGSSNGRNLNNMQICANGSSSQVPSGSGSCSANTSTSTSGANWSATPNVGYDTTRCVAARVQNTEGVWSAWARDCATSGPAPQPRAWVTKSNERQYTHQGRTCMNYDGSSGCPFLVLNVENFQNHAGNGIRVGCHRSGANGGAAYVTTVTNIPANGSVRLGCYNGFDDTVWASVPGFGNAESVRW